MSASLVVHTLFTVGAEPLDDHGQAVNQDHISIQHNVHKTNG
jgi:hypothetical protein